MISNPAEYALNLCAMLIISRKPSVALPALASESGAPSEAYVTYDSPHLTATLTHEGTLKVLPTKTQTGSGQIKAIRIGLSCRYKTDDTPPKKKSRRIIAFPNAPEPAKNPREVILQREHEDGVMSTATYTFSANEVTAEVTFEDPPNLSRPSYFNYVAKIPTSHPFPPETTVSERAAATKGYILSASGKKHPTIH